MARARVIRANRSQFNSSGRLESDKAEGGDYTLPAATASQRGGVRVGDNLTVSGDRLSAVPYDDTELTQTVDSLAIDTSVLIDEVLDLEENKQDTLVSGTNIKTINNESLLGPGNITVEGGGDYELPIASTTTLGGVKIDANNPRGLRILSGGALQNGFATQSQYGAVRGTTTGSGIRANGGINFGTLGNLSLTNAVFTAIEGLQTEVETKQDTLVSGTDIKTINNESLLGPGNITISGGGGGVDGYTGGALLPPGHFGNNPTDVVVTDGGVTLIPAGVRGTDTHIVVLREYDENDAASSIDTVTVGVPPQNSEAVWIPEFVMVRSSANNWSMAWPFSSPIDSTDSPPGPFYGGLQQNMTLRINGMDAGPTLKVGVFFRKIKLFSS